MGTHIDDARRYEQHQLDKTVVEHVQHGSPGCQSILSAEVALHGGPTRMNPIWDMEEQAKVRFKSMEKTASTAPSTIVTTPRASTTVFQGRSAQNR